MAFTFIKEKYRELQETFPVISLSFAGIKEPDYEIAWDKICEVLRGLYIKFSFLKNSNVNVYGVNTSANTLFSNLLQRVNPNIKGEFEELLRGKAIHKIIDEQKYEAGIWAQGIPFYNFKYTINIINI